MIRTYDTLMGLLAQRRQHSDLALPTAIGVGAARSGTSFLYSMLGKHPLVWCSPIKEMNFFGIQGQVPRRTRMSLSEYALFFEEGRNHACRFESSPVYLNHDPSLVQLCQTLPTAKVVVQLREPMDRLWSHFKHHIDYHGVTDFAEYLQCALDGYDSSTRTGTDWFSPAKALSASLYSDGIEFLQAHFGSSRMLVLDYRTLLKDPSGYMATVTEFLGVGRLQEDEHKRTNASSSEAPPLLPAAIRDGIHRLFDVDQARLAALVGWRYRFD